MPTARLLVSTSLVVLLVIAAGKAESNLPNEVLREAPGEVNSNNDSLIVTVPPPSLPDAPTPQKVKVIDKKFIFVMAALGGAETLRFTTHKLVLDNEFAAGAPWVTKVPANPHLVAKYGAIYAAELLVAYELKKPHSWLPGDKYIRKLWCLYPAAMAPIHIKNGVRSIRTQAPAECPPEYCQAQ